LPRPDARLVRPERREVGGGIARNGRLLEANAGLMQEWRRNVTAWVRNRGCLPPSTMRRSPGGALAG
jgi:hypothetical protein